jgi:hypothetical protein
VLSWFDTESGRYFTQASRGRDGRDWITIAPADAATRGSNRPRSRPAPTATPATSAKIGLRLLRTCRTGDREPSRFVGGASYAEQESDPGE